MFINTTFPKFNNTECEQCQYSWYWYKIKTYSHLSIIKLVFLINYFSFIHDHNFNFWNIIIFFNWHVKCHRGNPSILSDQLINCWTERVYKQKYKKLANNVSIYTSTSEGSKSYKILLFLLFHSNDV